MEYIPGSLQKIQLKTKGRKQHSATVTSPTSIMQLIANMKQIVAENSALLGRYESFFFAADARGVKLVTKQSFQDKNPQHSQTSFRTLMTLIGLICWTEARESFIWTLEYPSIIKALFLLLGYGSSTSCMTLMHSWAQKQDRFITLAPWDFMVDERQL